MRPETLVEAIQRRCYGIGYASLLLLVVVVATHAYQYQGIESSGLAEFAICVLVATVAAFMVATDSGLARMATGLLLELDPARSSRRPRRILLAVYVGAFFLIIALDFFAIGRVMKSTGGVVDSAYNQIPAIMLILGARMAVRFVSKLSLAILGVSYFLAVDRLATFGPTLYVPPDVADRRIWVFLCVTGVNLFIGITINQVEQRANERRRQISNGSDGSEKRS